MVGTKLVLFLESPTAMMLGTVPLFSVSAAFSTLYAPACTTKDVTKFTDADGWATWNALPHCFFGTITF